MESLVQWYKEKVKRLILEAQSVKKARGFMSPSRLVLKGVIKLASVTVYFNHYDLC